LVKDNKAMTTAIVKWGNSQGIRLPKALLKSADISKNDTVDILVKNEAIIIKKTQDKKHKTTRERLADFYGTKNKAKKHTEKQAEIDWGKPAGKEIW
jgi:antitoxin MazE